jgi:hypothetical protein
LLRYVPEYRSSPRVVIRKWPGTTHKLKTIKGAMNQTDQTTDMTQKFRTHVFKFLTPSLGKIMNLYGFR